MLTKLITIKLINMGLLEMEDVLNDINGEIQNLNDNNLSYLIRYVKIE